jgi:hypothetical protein
MWAMVPPYLCARMLVCSPRGGWLLRRHRHNCILAIIQEDPYLEILRCAGRDPGHLRGDGPVHPLAPGHSAFHGLGRIFRNKLINRHRLAIRGGIGVSSVGPALLHLLRHGPGPCRCRPLRAPCWPCLCTGPTWARFQGRHPVHTQGQTEAARSLGMTQASHVPRHLPQAFKTILPPVRQRVRGLLRTPPGFPTVWQTLCGGAGSMPRRASQFQTLRWWPGVPLITLFLS